jgi:hypothetical protein
MANGQQIAEENFKKFSAWRASKTHADFRAMVSRGILSRKDIVAECGFSPSALTQNPRIRVALADLEATLREEGVLPLVSKNAEAEADAPPQRQPGRARQAIDAERLSRLEVENAILNKKIDELERLLARFTVLREALAESGRLPR